MKFEKTEVFNFEGAIRGMRNSWESWDKSDSYICHGDKIACEDCKYYENPFGDSICQKEDGLGYGNYIGFHLGKNDLKLMQKLIRLGTPHRKFLRQIMVSVDITAPLYWWKEFDTYKVGTVSNSCSTMHTLTGTPITKECFEKNSNEHLEVEANAMIQSRQANEYEEEETVYGWMDSVGMIWENLIDSLEAIRKKYLETKDKRYWKELVRLLPESWLQKRTISMNYENILNMLKWRKDHKLTEWSKDFCEWVMSLPYTQELFEEPFKMEEPTDERKNVL